MTRFFALAHAPLICRSVFGPGFGTGSSGGSGDPEPTDLSVERDATTVTVRSSTGVDAAIPAADSGGAGVFTTAEQSKLAGVEASATADQTGTEIVSAIDTELGGTTWQEGGSGSTDLGVTLAASTVTVTSSSGNDAAIGAATASDAGVLAAADKSKLDGIEAAATADQTGAEIKTAYEAEADTNAFTDAEQSKLAGIEASATADQTGAEIKTAYEAEADTNAFTDAEQSKLAGIEAAATADQTGAEIKTAYEAEADTNAFTDAEQSKLAGIEASATADQTGTEIVSAIDTELGGTTWQQGGSGDQTDFETKAAAESATITTAWARTAGYSAAGDGGGGLYKQVGGDPGHDLKFQDAALTWFGLVPEDGMFNVLQNGAVRNLDGTVPVTDSAAAIQGTLDAVQYFADDFNGASPRVHAPLGKYRVDSTLELRTTTTLSGDGIGIGFDATQFHFPADTPGLVVHHHDTTLTGKEDPDDTATKGGDASVIRDIGFVGSATAFDMTKSGVWLRGGRVVLERAAARGFAGHGFRIHAVAGAGDPAEEGNANVWRAERLVATDNYGSGLFVDGADANIGYASGLDLRKNGRWGVEEDSFLGNVYVGVHTAANGVAGEGGNGAGETSVVHLSGRHYSANVGATEADLVATQPGTDENVWIDIRAGSSSASIPDWQAGQTEGTYFHGGAVKAVDNSARNAFFGLYAEGNQGLIQAETPTMIQGGLINEVHGTAFVLDGTTLDRGQLKIPARKFDTNAIEWILRPDNNDGTLWRFVADGDHSAGLRLIWDDTLGVLTYRHANVSARDAIRLTTDLTAADFGRTAPPTGGFANAPHGFLIGDGGEGRHINFERSADFEGVQGAPGDLIIHNHSLGVDNTFGWVRRDTGGTYRELPKIPTIDGAILLPQVDPLPDPAQHTGAVARDVNDRIVYSDGTTWDVPGTKTRVVDITGNVTLGSDHVGAVARGTDASPTQQFTLDATSAEIGQIFTILARGGAGIDIVEGTGTPTIWDETANATLPLSLAQGSKVQLLKVTATEYQLYGSVL